MATTSIHYDCLTGIETVLEALTFDGITGANPLPASRIVVQNMLTERVLTIPAIVIFPWPVPESMERGTNVEDDWGYPCGVGIIIPKNQSLTIDPDEFGWRQKIRNAFHHKRPTALQTALGASVPLKICRVEPQPVLDLGLLRDSNLFVSTLMIRVVTREAR